MGIAFCQGKGYWIATRALLLYLSVSPQTREAASASWKARVLPTELHRVVCVCVLLRVHSCECVGVSALALTGSPVVILTI